MSANNLPPETTEAILRLLPVKSLGRFKSVSKKWNSLISDPHFIKTHLHQHINGHQTRKLILVSMKNSLYSVGVNELLPYHNNDNIRATAKKLSFRSKIRWVEILSSCNGLVLAKDGNDALVLTNLTTRVIWTIPISHYALSEEQDAYVEKLCVCYGFGYDSTTDDYKVLRISYWDPHDHYDYDYYYDHTDYTEDTVVTVYSLRRNSWRRLPDFPYDNPAFQAKRCVLINQNLHWLVSSSSSSSMIIVAFSLANEEFSEIKLLDLFEEYRMIYDLVDIGGKLGVVLGIGFGNRNGYELWMMEEYGACKSWTKVFSNNIGVYIRPNPVCLVEGSDRDIVLGETDILLVYNMDECRCRDIRIVGGPREFIIGGTYVESLESPARFITAPSPLAS